VSNKNVVISAVIIVSIIAFITLLEETFMTLQAINPIAIIAALTVAVIGIAWFRKTIR